MSDDHLLPALSPRALVLLPVAVLPPMLASLLGAYATAPALASWYPLLAKPFFTPPNIAFPLVWTVLYALMAISFWRILRAPPGIAGRSVAIWLFLGQIVLNAGWSYAFFATRSPLAGLVVIALLFLAIVLMIRAFRRIDAAAGWAQLPYALWVAYAGLLNAAIAILNP